jgi:hypothetical protein
MKLANSKFLQFLDKYDNVPNGPKYNSTINVIDHCISKIFPNLSSIKYSTRTKKKIQHDKKKETPDKKKRSA